MPVPRFAFLKWQRGTVFPKRKESHASIKIKGKILPVSHQPQGEKKISSLENKSAFAQAMRGGGGVIKDIVKKPSDRSGPGILGKCGPHPRCGAMNRA